MNMPFMQPAQAARMGRQLAAPFQLALVGKNSRSARFFCEAILRVQPGRRAVMRGQWQGQQAVAKVYFGHRAHRDCRRAQRGAELLRKAGIAAPEMLAAIHGADGRCACAVFAYLEGSAPAADDGTLPRSVREAVRSLHRAGLVHRDLHFGNFLLHGKQAYLLDPEGIALGRSTRSRRRNAALLLAQLPPLARQEALAEEGSTAEFAREAEQLWQRRVDRHGKKVFRDCSKFRVWQENGKRIFCQRAAVLQLPQLAALAADPDTYMAQGEPLKSGGSATVTRIRVHEQALVVKRYNLKGPLHFVRRCLGPSRARRAWRNAHMLRHIGIRTPSPLALTEERCLGGLLPGRAWLISRYQDGHTLAQCTAADRLPPVQADREIARVFLLLQRVGLRHGDLKASNWILSEDNAYLVDLDALRRHRGPQRDLQRFLDNWPPGSICRRHYEQLLESLS